MISEPEMMWTLPESFARAALLAEDGPSLGLQNFLPFMLGLLVLMYFFFWRPEQRDRKRRDDFRRDLKVNDKVITTGGVVGTIASIHPNGLFMELKIDENTGTKMRILRSAVLMPYDDLKKAEGEGKKTEPTGTTT